MKLKLLLYCLLNPYQYIDFCNTDGSEVDGRPNEDRKSLKYANELISIPISLTSSWVFLWMVDKMKCRFIHL